MAGEQIKVIGLIDNEVFLTMEEVQAILNNKFAGVYDTLADGILDGARQSFLEGSSTIEELKGSLAIRTAFKLFVMDPEEQDEWFDDLVEVQGNIGCNGEDDG